MDGTKLLTQQRLEQILIKTISRGQDNEKIRVIELIEEIKQLIITEKSKMET
ncbi:hypothetical protein J1P26_03835 [Neobacillus sp. MM2021_6]|uniref:hypothetical protein n=1 Tax=Bacillaceae TaxID=186817 RepID=UPI00140A7CB9|nr:MULTISPECIES: hypothetical protein [Bacillaceae]MBO0958852.1 hypothetical protein [Neobacillus sp. MM2021_6]NHC21321.1 hypothetical protein [Bacillus sp. MM2020_4]